MFNKYVNSRYLGYGQNALLSLPIALYFAVVYRYSVNIPTLDDYAAVLDFLRYFREARGFDKFPVLFTQHGEHRILASRIVYVLSDMLPGEINFRTLIFLGNLQLLLTLLIAIYFIRRNFPQHWLVLSFVASLFLFDLSNWENAHFAMASMQNYGVLLLFSAGLFFYAQKSAWFLLPAAIVQAVCIFSSGNGIVASVFIILSCVIERNPYKITLSSVVTLAFAPLYFVAYDSTARAQPSTNYPEVAAYLLRLLSGHIHSPDPMLKVVFGVLILVVSAWVLPVGKRLRISQSDAFFIAVFGFLLASMALTALFRSAQGPMPPSRYLIYAHYAALIVFLFGVKKIKQERLERFILAVAILGILNYIPSFEYGTKAFISITDKIKSADFDYPDKNVAKTIAERCCAEGIYCIERHRTGR